MQIPAQIPKRLHDLYEAAARAKQNAYAPYSRFKVGAAIRTTSGKIFAGANIEYVVNGISVCAERGVLQHIVSELGRVDMAELLVVTEGSPPAAPCGACRQSLLEFLPKGQDLDVHAVNPKGEILSTTLRALVPHAYTPDYVAH
jgi:cytidine deaminase